MTARADRWRALIVDDEPLARRTLRLLLEAQPDVEIAGECEHGEAAVAAIRQLHPDVVFLDVEMPGVSGMDVLREVGATAVPVVVFVTAYDRYAVRAFEAHALDYLLKPFSDQRFADTVERVRGALKHRRLGEAEKRLDAWLRDKARERRELVVRDGARTFVLPWNDIEWISAEDYCIRIHAGRQNPLVRHSLQSILSQLDPILFARAHRSAIVNLEKVREVRPLSAGDSEVVLSDGTVVRMSRKYRAAFLAQFHSLHPDRV